MKRLWLVRLGRNGEGEARALEQSDLALGFHVADLSAAKNRDAVLAIVKESYPNEKPKTQLNFAAQLNQFCNVIQTGDLVVVPLKTTGQIGIAEISGTYAHDAKLGVCRKVKWFRQDIPREAFRQDLLYSFGAFMTVCEVSRNDAQRRVEAVIKTGSDPGYESGPTKDPQKPEAQESDSDVQRDFAQLARDQIEKRIASAFTGHQFTDLVAEVLKAQGYQVSVSPPGADSGIDIVAGQGALGFGSPRLVVQVKSGNVVVDQPTLQALKGAIQETEADHGLIVSWGGFKRSVDSKRNELFFRVRLWGRKQLVDALLDVYERLPEEFRAELALKRTWTLVPDDDPSAA